MFRFAPYILKTLWRHRLRTFLTMSGAAVALFVYSMVGSMQQSLDDLKNQSDRSLIIFQANKFCPASSLLQQDYEHNIKKISGVREVLPVQVFTNNCRASLDVVVFHGVPVERLQRFRDFQIIAGSWEEFEKYQDAAFVGRDVARRRGLQAGQKFSIGGVTVTVAGIFSSAERAEENYIYTHLRFLQRRLGESREGMVTQFEILIDESANAEAVCKVIDETFHGAPLPTDTRTKGHFQASSLADLYELVDLGHYLGLACIGLMIVLVTTTSLMSVQDRVREHAVLQTLGFTPWKVFGLVMSEGIVMSLLGGGIGIVVAMILLVWPGFAVGADAVVVSFAPSLELAAGGLVTALVIGLVAGFFPAWQAARAEIVPSLRQV